MKRKVHPENEIACLRLSLTGSGPAAYGHRRSSRKDLPGFVGRRPRPRRSLHSNQLCPVVERSLSWLSLYRRLNTVFDQTNEHLIALAECFACYENYSACFLCGGRDGCSRRQRMLVGLRLDGTGCL